MATDYIEKIQTSDGVARQIDYEALANLPSSVLYSEQTLTDEQKAQARTNINAAEVDGEYELIEEITLSETSAITRTQEPDGTPYRLTHVIVKASTSADTGSGNVARYYCGDQTIGLAWWAGKTGVTNQLRRMDRVEQENGRWFSQFVDWTTGNAGTTQRYVDNHTAGFSVEQYPYIDRISILQKLPAGAVVQIWGVRA